MLVRIEIFLQALERTKFHLLLIEFAFKILFLELFDSLTTAVHIPSIYYISSIISYFLTLFFLFYQFVQQTCFGKL